MSYMNIHAHINVGAEPDQEEPESSEEEEPEKSARELKLLKVLQATDSRIGSFKGKKRPQTKWLKKDPEVIV